MTGDDAQENGLSPAEEEQPTHPGNQAYQEILAEIYKQQSAQKSWVKNIVILLVSLLIFFQLGLFRGGLRGVLLIIAVLVIHETGHLLGMRLFGYQNVQMFFIPFFGAAVSGQSRNVAAYKKAIVSLLGPLPGIVIGCVLLLMFAATSRQDYLYFASAFLFINCFNLLPLYPLDGGRFLYTIIFSRNPYLEFLFRCFAALALILLGYVLGAWLLALLGLFNLWAVRIPFKLSKITKQIRRSGVYFESLEDIDKTHVDAEIPPLPAAQVIIDKLYECFPPPVEIGTIARYTNEVWERLRRRSPGVFSSAALMLVYVFAFCLPFVAFIASMLVSYVERRGFVESKLVHYQIPDGAEALKEQIYFGRRLDSEIEVDPESYLYHGRDVRYTDANTVLVEGMWSQGWLDGEWKVYDTNGDFIRITFYDKGEFASRKVKVNGEWIDKGWDDLPFIAKWRIRSYQKQPRGPNPTHD